MLILETAFKNREFDGKFIRLGKIFDHDNTYRYVDENNKQVKYIPTKWVVMGVYDHEMEIVDKNGNKIY